MTNLSDEELERRLRCKWFRNEGPVKTEFSPDEQRIAQKLLGRDNAERLQRHRPDGRRFRPVPVIIHYEYWWVNGDRLTMGGWHMARVENGRRTDHRYTGSTAHEITRLKAAGFTVKEIPIDGAPSLHPPKRQRTGGRAFILDKLKDFKL